MTTDAAGMAAPAPQPVKADLGAQLHQLAELYGVNLVKVHFNPRGGVALLVGADDTNADRVVGSGSTLAVALVRAFTALAKELQEHVTMLELDLLSADTRKAKAFLLSNGLLPKEPK